MSRELLKAGSAAEAVSRKKAGTAFLAGGTELLRLGSIVHADALIMLKGLEELRGITAAEDGIVRIGAMTTFEEALESELTPDYLKKALRYMASGTKRNMATIGGQVSLLRDDSYLGAVLIAAHAKLEMQKKDEDRDTICIRRYLLNREEYQDALITAVLVRNDVRVVSKRYANTAESHSYLTVAMGLAGGAWRIGISVKNSGVFYAKEESEKLTEDREMGRDILPERFADFAKTWDGLDIPDDMYGSTEYKRYLLGVTLDDLYRELKAEEKASEKKAGKEA